MGREVTITKPTQGLIDDAQGDIGPTPFVVQPGTYDVEDLDDDQIYLVVDEVPDVCVVVTRAALGLVECVACDGRGEYSYRVSEDDWEADECGCCDGLGAVTPEAAAKLEADRERMLDEQMRNGVG